MTIKHHSNIRNLMLGRGILSGFTLPHAITVYSGVQPTAAQITANWAAYNSAVVDYLNHYVGANWTQPLNGALLQLTIPPIATPVRSGNATWCILWSTNVSKATTDAAVLPSTSFIVAPVSDGIGNGVIRFNNIALVAGTPVTILDGSIGSTST